MALTGNIILIGMGTNIIAGVKHDDIQTNCDLIETASPSSSDWKTYLAGRKEWAVTVNYLVSSAGNIRDVLKTGNTFSLYFIHRDAVSHGGIPYLTGSAILKTCRIDETVGNLVQGSFQFVGNGVLTSPQTGT